MSDLVPRRDVDRSVELPRLHGTGTFQQPADRPRDAGADEHRERQSEDRGQRGQDRRYRDILLLIPHRQRGIGTDLRHHIGANAIDPLIEFVAQRIDAGEAFSDLREILGFGFQQRKQPVVLFVEIAQNVLVGVLDPAIDPPQRGIVRFGGDVIDDGVDQRVNRAGFLADRNTGRFIALLALGKAILVGRRLHFGDHHPAQLERPLERIRLHPRQMIVGFEIFRRQLIELMGDFPGQHRRQCRDNDHEDDQPDSNAEDLPSNRRPHH